MTRLSFDAAGGAVTYARLDAKNAPETETIGKLCEEPKRAAGIQENEGYAYDIPAA